MRQNFKAKFSLCICPQHLFMQQPRSIFLVSSLLMLTVLLGLFIVYHCYLVLNNQTTNERYKMSALTSHKLEKGKNSHDRMSNANGNSSINGNQSLSFHHESKVVTKCQYNMKSKEINKENILKANNNIDPSENKAQVFAVEDFCLFYNKGIWLNVKEVFLPWTGLKRKTAVKKNFLGTKKKMKRQ